MSIIEKLNERIAQELIPIDTRTSYDQMLNDAYSFEKVGGPFCGLAPSRVLRELKPTDYRCGYNDYVNAWVYVGGEYYLPADVERVKSDLIEELEAEVTELDAKTADYARDVIIKNIATLNAHSF